MNCLHCGAPVLINDVCSACGLKQEYLIRAWNTSLHYYNQGLAYAGIRNLTSAELALKTALRYNKANIDARNLLGLVYYETGQVIEALVQWVISSNYQAEENPAVRYLNLVQGNQNKLNAYDQSAKKYNLTLHYVRQKNYDLALIQLKRILSDNPHFVKAYLVLALIYMQEGNTERAKRALQRVMKIDRYHPMAQQYLEELSKHEKEYMSGLAGVTAVYDDELPSLNIEDSYGDELEEEEADGEETARRKIREIIERGAAAEDVGAEQNLEVGSYQEIKYGKHNVMYLIAGLIIGIAAVYFLIMPAKIKSIQNEDRDMKTSFRAELSGKNDAISNLNEEKEKLENQISSLTKQIEDMEQESSGSNVEETWMTGIQAYLTGDKAAAVAALGSCDMNGSEMSEATKSCLQSVIDGCGEELSICRSTGMTAFGANNYAQAIEQLTPYCNLKPDDVEARFQLAEAYKATGDLDAANRLYQDINTRFPDSQYVTEGN